MKCLKCNEEALFVNGKYVCVDCGIEITPAEQAAQYSSDNLFDGSSGVVPHNPITSPDPFSQQDLSQMQGQNQTPSLGGVPVGPVATEEDPITPADTGVGAVVPSYAPPANEGYLPSIDGDTQLAPEENRDLVQEVSVPEVVEADQPQKVTIEKPIEAYYKSELEKNEPAMPTISQEKEQTGIYDFSENNVPKEPLPLAEMPPYKETQENLTVESSFENIVPEEAVQAEQAPEPIIPTTEAISPIAVPEEIPGQTEVTAQLGIAPTAAPDPSSLDNFNTAEITDSLPTKDQGDLLENTYATDQEPPQEPIQTSTDYFQPNTFELNKAQENVEEIATTENLPPESQSLPKVEPDATFSEVSIGDPLAPSQEAPMPVTPLEERDASLEVAPNNNLEPDLETISAPLPESSTTAEPQTQITESAEPIAMDVFEQPNKAANLFSEETIEKNQPMPSVESVFGKESGAPSNPQDYGLPAPTPPNEKKRKMIIIAAACGVLVVGVAISLAVFLGGRQSPYPVALAGEQIKQLSTFVTEAMDKKQDISSSYELEADFSGITLNDPNAKELQEKLAAPLKSKGDWLVDEEGNIHFSSSIRDKNVKQTFLAQERGTFTYDEAKSQWVRSEGNTINKIPVFIDPENRSLVFYVTNIRSASLVGVENIEDIRTNVYEIRPEKGFIENLNFLGEPFTGASFISTDASGLTIRVWLGGGEDRRIHRLKINGNINVTGSDFSGDITLNSTANFKYQNVLIKDPRTEASAIPNLERSIFEASQLARRISFAS